MCYHRRNINYQAASVRKICSHHFRPAGGTLWLALLALTLAAQSNAQVATVLHSFTGALYDGAKPIAGVAIGSAGVLYGATFDGGSGIACGAAGCGTIYSLTPPSSPGGLWTEAVLYSFLGGGIDGENPAATLIMNSAGVLYGTTYAGGTSSGGTVFSLTPPTTPGAPWTEAVLYNFIPGNKNGAFPAAGLAIDTNGVLYGTTLFGGNSSVGVVFSLTPPAVAGMHWTQAVVVNLSNLKTGSLPMASLALADNHTIYGTTGSGGAAGYGTAFLLKQAPSGGAWRPTLLHSFGGPTVDGATPESNLAIGTGGVLYGTTYSGGTFGKGTVYSLTPPAVGSTSWTESVLYNFTGGSDGGEPRAGVLLTSTGTLYGTTYDGGSAGSGAVYFLTPPATTGAPWTEAVTYSFPGGSGGGNSRSGLVMDATGLLYGTTYSGGLFSLGTVFSLLP